MDAFLAHGLKPLSLYVPDVEALRGGAVKVLVGAGQSSKGQFAHRAAAALAEKLGTDLVIFPGGHDGFGSHPDIFAETLNRALQKVPIGQEAPTGRSPSTVRDDCDDHL